MKPEPTETRSCEECGLIHKNGISWHGRCYSCWGELASFDFSEVELTATTPKGIQIYEKLTPKK
jgi:hypothetical protein